MSRDGAAATPGLLELRRIIDALPHGASVSLPREYLLEVLPSSAAVVSPDPAELAIEDVAAKFGRSASTVRGWLEAGRFPGAYKLRGRSWRIPRAALEAFLRAQQAEVPAVPAGARGSRGRSIGDWRKTRAAAS